jgi:predicted XRE-type DNA-binding protein
MSEGITPSSGNIFADLGLPYPEEELAKSDLVGYLSTILDERKLALDDAARLFKVTSTKLSSVLSGHLSGLTLDRLIRFLTALGEEVEITVRHVFIEGKDENSVYDGRSLADWAQSIGQTRLFQSSRRNFETMDPRDLACIREILHENEEKQKEKS